MSEYQIVGITWRMNETNLNLFIKEIEKLNNFSINDVFTISCWFFHCYAIRDSGHCIIIIYIYCLCSPTFFFIFLFRLSVFIVVDCRHLVMYWLFGTTQYSSCDFNFSIRSMICIYMLYSCDTWWLFCFDVTCPGWTVCCAIQCMRIGAFSFNSVLSIKNMAACWLKNR